MNPQLVKIGKILINIFKLSFVSLCISLTLWQSFKGLIKYLSFPQGSSLILSELSKESLPDLTFCPAHPYGAHDQNETFKENCGFSYTDLWASETCPDSEMNYHGIYDVPSLLFNSIRYLTGTCHPTLCFLTRSFRMYPGIVKPQNIHHAVDLRCYTISLPESIKNTSISKLTITTKGPFFLKIHTKGMFFTEVKYIKVSDVMMNAELTYEIFKQINTQEQPCIEDPSYRKDDCIVEQIQADSLAMFGCTTPYGRIKDRSCVNATLMKQAREFYDYKIMADEYQQCPNPCTTITSTFNIRNQIKNKNEAESTQINIEFPSKVKVIQAYHAFTILSLVAEVGGYVGLFLGVSVLDLKSLIKTEFM